MDITEYNISKPNIQCTEIDYLDMFDNIYNIVDDYISNNIIKLYDPKYYDNIIIAVFDNLKNAYYNIYNETIEENINLYIQVCFNIYFSKIIPRRSYKTTFVKKITNSQFQYIKKRIEYLSAVPQPEQRTNEWYLFRYNLITASSAWKIFMGDKYTNNLIYEKCTPLDLNKYKSNSTEGPLHWGQKYEPLSVLYYEDKYNTTIDDFGCIKDEQYKFLGASPDGINTDINSSRYGRMLEIKNRYSFSVPITGIPKPEYWIQMQLQMNVCKLNECDFLETRFIEYSNKTDFDHDGTFNLSSDNKPKGVFIAFIVDTKPVYFYPKFNISKSEYEKWEKNLFDENKDNTLLSYIYWKLDKVSCVLVAINTVWYDTAVTDIENVWNTIKAERITGYNHRAPKKRVKTTKYKCLI